MKLSVSLPDDDVAFLDRYAEAKGHLSRSAVLRHAVRALRNVELAGAYEEAWVEWEVSGAAAAWSVTAGDGVRDDAAR